MTLIFLLILIFDVDTKKNTIYLKFTNSQFNDKINNQNISNFIQFLFENEMTSEIEVGNPYSKIELKLISTSEPLSMFERNSKSSSSKYIFNKSLTFTDQIFVEDTNIYRIGFDYFKFYLDKKEEEEISHETQNNINKMRFLLGYHNISSTFAKAGVFSNGHRYNLIGQMKNLGYVNSYYWTYEFVDTNSGYLVIGSLPHEINSKKYTEKNYIETYSVTEKSKMNGFGLKFKHLTINLLLVQ